MTTARLADHIEARREDYQSNAEDMRGELRQLAAFLAGIDWENSNGRGALDSCCAQELSRHIKEVQTQAARMDRSLARYTETRAALGALLALDSAQD